MGVPLNHQFYFWVFQYKPSIFGDSPCMKTLILQIYWYWGYIIVSPFSAYTPLFCKPHFRFFRRLWTLTLWNPCNPWTWVYDPLASWVMGSKSHAIYTSFFNMCIYIYILTYHEYVDINIIKAMHKPESHSYGKLLDITRWTNINIYIYIYRYINIYKYNIIHQPFLWSYFIDKHNWYFEP